MLLIYIRSGSPVISEAVIALLWPLAMCAMAKNIKWSSIMRYIATSLHPLLTDTVHWHPAHAPWCLIFLSVIFFAHFWLVVASPLSTIPSADIHVHDFIFDFYHPLTLLPSKTIVSHFPRASRSGIHTLHTPLRCGHLFLVGCCLITDGGRQKSQCFF